MIEVALNEWTDSKGNVRRYVNNWWILCGIIDHDQQGLQLEAGAWVTKADQARITSTKVWIDAQDQVHVDRFGGTVATDLTEESIAQAVAAWTKSQAA